MKATGIVRRIDDLGRIVIPKEIRRTMHIREGDPLEIYTARDGEVIFKKYSAVQDATEYAAGLSEALHRTAGCYTAICDRNSFVSVSGTPKKELTGRPVSSELEQIMDSRRTYVRSQSGQHLPVSEAAGRYEALAAVPIVSNSDVLGCVLLFGQEDQKAGELECKLAQTAALFMEKQMEY